MVKFRCPVKFTSRAWQEILNRRVEKNIPPDYSIRVGIREHARQNAKYLLGFDTQTEEDMEFTEDGLSVIIRKSGITGLNNKLVDFHEDPGISGFVFSER